MVTCTVRELDKLGDLAGKGVKRARELLELIQDGSNPKHSVLDLLADSGDSDAADKLEHLRGKARHANKRAINRSKNATSKAARSRLSRSQQAAVSKRSSHSPQANRTPPDEDTMIKIEELSATEARSDQGTPEARMDDESASLEGTTTDETHEGGERSSNSGATPEIVRQTSTREREIKLELRKIALQKAEVELEMELLRLQRRQ
jgi:hypothetical protein